LFCGHSVEEGSNIGCHLSTHGLAGHIRARVLLQMKLAALPWESAQDGSSGCAQAGMIIANYQMDTAHAAIPKTLQKGFPMGFVIAEQGGNP